MDWEDAVFHLCRMLCLALQIFLMFCLTDFHKLSTCQALRKTWYWKTMFMIYSTGYQSD
jgi:hypothetical protein